MPSLLLCLPSRLLLVLAAAAGAALAAAAAAVDDSAMKAGSMPLFLLDAHESTKSGAVCLDGSPPGYYYSAFSSAAKSSTWVLYFKGGGWCWNEADCLSRSKGELGSSKHFPSSWPNYGGPMGADASLNPDFAEGNRALLWYCDGASFTGNKEDPVKVPGSGNQTGGEVYFRGRRVLDALLDDLIGKHGLGSATDVLLSGGSAGALAAYLHADYVRSRLPWVTRFKVAPISGFFLDHATVTGQELFPGETEKVVAMQNSTGGLNQACVKAMSMASQMEGTGGQTWKCMFANYSFAHTASPVFAINSALDAWQMGHIWKQGCTSSGQFGNCTGSELAQLRGYEADFMRDLTHSGNTLSKPGNGAFVESCLEHVAAQGVRFNQYTISGVTVQQALSAWWNAPSNAPANDHIYRPCMLSDTPPHQCNPSCGTDFDQATTSDLET